MAPTHKGSGLPEAPMFGPSVSQISLYNAEPPAAGDEYLQSAQGVVTPTIRSESTSLGPPVAWATTRDS